MSQPNLTDTSAQALGCLWGYRFDTLGTWKAKNEGVEFPPDAVRDRLPPSATGDCIMWSAPEQMQEVFRGETPKACVEAAIAKGALSSEAIPMILEIERAASQNGFEAPNPQALAVATNLLNNIAINDSNEALPEVQELIDELVHDNSTTADMSSEQASVLNNQGLVAQLSFLASLDLRAEMTKIRSVARDMVAGAPPLEEEYYPFSR
ncbi:hypothetical protein [Acetobacter persici]|uniref:Uncharacterized protein n=1 Tax=Acetobacter persici TaxID=1076596 RepID=A0A1U9LJK7_9PROT|nr:hypothetical protein [Acetobacter persici]AQT06529.1 hypothetical protein A0U91_16100 [Acetobacter persici]